MEHEPHPQPEHEARIDHPLTAAPGWLQILDLAEKKSRRCLASGERRVEE
jgi:hypothetical protein